MEVKVLTIEDEIKEEIKQRFLIFLQEDLKKDFIKVRDKGLRSIVIDYYVFAERFYDVKINGEPLPDVLLEHPDSILKILEEAIAENLEDLGLERPISVRFRNLPKSTERKISEIRSHDVGKFVTIEGIIRRTSQVEVTEVESYYMCPICQYVFSISIGQKLPRLCPKCRKRKGSDFDDFILVKKVVDDVQQLVIEDLWEKLDPNEQPQRIHVLLRGDLTDPQISKKLSPGSKIVVYGVVDLMPVKKKKEEYRFYIRANYIETKEYSFEEIEITEEDEKKIKELAQRPDVYDLFIDSVAPTIYGHREIKEAIVLQLFGGVTKYRPDGTKARGDIHILLVGDPGTGKSILPDEKVVLIINGKLVYDNIGKIIDSYMEKYKDLVVKEGDHEILYLDKINEEIFTYSIDPKGFEIKLSKVKAFIRHKINDEIIRIKLRSGKEISGTKDHSFLVVRDKLIAVKGTEIKVGDLVPVVKKLNVNPPSCLYEYKGFSLNWDLGYLVGYFIGDGSILHTNDKVYVGFTVKKDSSKLEEILKKYNVKYYNYSGDIRIFDKRFLDFFMEFYKEFGYTGKKGIKTRWKYIPDWVINSNEEFLKGFLVGLIESDGWINLKEKEIVIELVSKDVIEKLQIILARLGIIYTVNFEKEKSYKDSSVEIFRISLIKIPEWLEKELGIKFEKRIDYFDLIPLKPFGKELLEADLLKIDEIRGKFYRGYVGREYAKRKILPRLKDGLLKNLIEKDEITFEKVVEIKTERYSGYVYDLSVEEYENFVANMIFVHNSQLLSYVASIAPKARYVSAKGATTAGLTATVVRDEVLGTWAVEAGALVLAHRGLVCIDEIDKMSKEDRAALHTAMEQQIITIDKANVHVTLRCETSILAAANPKFGRFDENRPVVEQIDLPPTLLSRFDLIFVIRDEPRKDEDIKIASYIVETHRAPEQFKPKIDPDLLRKYIAYAKKYVFPRLTDEAKARIVQFYADLRDKIKKKSGTVPITARQLEAIIRLAEASARVRLSDKVTVEDVERAIRLMTYSLRQIAWDPEAGTFDIDTLYTGTPRSTRDRKKILLEVIEELSKEKYPDGVPYGEILKEYAKRVNKSEDEVVDEVEKLLENMVKYGEVFQPSPGKYLKT